MNKYLSAIFSRLNEKYYYQKEYLQTVLGFFNSIDEIVKSDSQIEELGIIERLVEPDRIITFKVPWQDDQGNIKVNIGYRIQFNNLIGPYKGGIRFDASVNESVLKFLGFEQTFKNALTGLPLGGAKGGSDFNPLDKSDNEIMRFCQSYMVELYNYIGPDRDIPAGDLGVGAKEVGYMFGMYKRLTQTHNGTFTGKGLSFGGSLLRPEATGYGLCYITEKALNTYYNTSLKDKTVIISGTGNVAIPTAKKATTLGAKVIAMSNITGVVYDSNGIDVDLISSLAKENKPLSDYLKTYSHVTFNKDLKSIWKIKTDVALPCATQNEIDEDDADSLLKNGLILLGEGANRPSTNEAIDLLIKNKIVLIPSKAANAGGVATSGLEMSQNAMNLPWSSNEVDEKLKDIMNNIFNEIYETALSHSDPYNLEKGANIYSFLKILDAMKAQGL
ncbi:MAG: NADP-specific glutamate dehydrogenase [Acholeplasma sp.]|nr:NADP-specific glutamate dehydrogenase [Acholeplasma sp.]